MSTTSLFGREQAIAEVAGLVEQPGVRLVTLTGPGGVGKTRLAVAVGERLRDRFGAGTVFVPLEAVTDPGLVLAAIGRAAGADLSRAGSPLEALADVFGDGAWLLVLDNLEQVVQAAAGLGELLARCPGVAILATSRTALGLRAEREYPVPPLPPPADRPRCRWRNWRPRRRWRCSWTGPARCGPALPSPRATRRRWPRSAGVWRACRWRSSWPPPAPGCWTRPRCWTGWPASLDALGTGAVDLPARQRTLRATVEWSVGLLTDAERSLLEVAAVFTDGWTIAAAAQVAGLDEDRALELSEALARHSLVYVDNTEAGPRTRMLETVRAFVAERLAARPDAAEVAPAARRLLPGAGRAGGPATARRRLQRLAGAAAGRGGQPGRRGALVPGP